MPLFTEKNRPIATKKVVIDFNPKWNPNGSTFTSANFPIVTFHTEEIYDTESMDGKPNGNTTLRIQAQIDQGLTTAEKVAETMATFREWFYNEQLITFTPPQVEPAE